MSIIRNFKAVRPAVQYAQQVAALPYDVMNESEARAMTANNPISFLNVDRSEVHFPVGTDLHGVNVYEKAREVLQNFARDGILVQDEKPCLYIYRLTMDKRSQTGLVACTSVDEYLAGRIKKHEFTRKDKEKDRINHVDYCNANTGPIFLAYKDKYEVQFLIEEWTKLYTPIYNFTAEDGIGHKVWIIDDKQMIDTITEAFKAVENLYIADGHHRAASAVQVALKRREENKSYTGTEEFNFFLSVIFPAGQLKIMDYNRIVSDLNGLTEEQLLTKIKENFDVKQYDEKGSFSPKEQHQFGMFLGGKWYVLTAKTEKITDDLVGGLDVSILQDKLLTPILGIGDSRTDKRVDFVGGIRGLEELEQRVVSGQAKVAFSMYPTSMEELMAVADSNRVMPPKSTWFEPKLRSGLFIHNLE